MVHDTLMLLKETQNNSKQSPGIQQAWNTEMIDYTIKLQKVKAFPCTYIF